MRCAPCRRKRILQQSSSKAPIVGVTLLILIEVVRQNTLDIAYYFATILPMSATLITNALKSAQASFYSFAYWTR